MPEAKVKAKLKLDH